MPRCVEMIELINRITPKALEGILPLVHEEFGALIGRYQENVYPPDIYQDAMRRFQHPAAVDHQSVELALAWKYGRRGKNRNPNARIPPGHTETIRRVASWFKERHFTSWPRRWQILMKSLELQARFVSRAFITHLAYPNQVPIIDKWNFKATGFLLRKAGILEEEERFPSLPSKTEHIYLLSAFKNSLIQVAGRQIEMTDQSVDRFLMMFGKHHVGGRCWERC
jgi:hypothetical protein